ncbi:hypothetical protein J6590_023105 [Homalodisca vitripennis]|nr:hypothetical protein J6590_023105 [Homalodisca vitripennis]
MAARPIAGARTESSGYTSTATTSHQLQSARSAADSPAIPTKFNVIVVGQCRFCGCVCHHCGKKNHIAKQWRTQKSSVRGVRFTLSRGMETSPDQ